MLTVITLFRLITASLLPVLVTVIFYLAEKQGRFGKASYARKQTIIGLSFGVVAILATEFGIPMSGAIVNVRNAAPLTAGLVFGWPAGLIAGMVGGVERYFTPAGDFTRIACTFGTIIAGILGAMVRRFMMDNKKSSWLYGLMVGVTSEVIHMLMVFVTNLGDLQRAFEVVEICAIPMISANGFSVMAAIWAITKLSKNREEKGNGRENISQTFQRWLLLCVVVAFCVTMVCSGAFLHRIAYSTAELTLQAGIEDVRNDVQDMSDRELLETTREIAKRLPRDISTSVLLQMAQQYGVAEINLINKDGIITMEMAPFKICLAKASCHAIYKQMR